jgi:putative membrane protein
VFPNLFIALAGLFGTIFIMKSKEFWIDFLKGTTIGFAIPIPGVSGGTMAVLTGIFDKIANAVANIKKDFWGSFRSVLPIILGALFMAIIGFLGIKKGFEFAPFALSALFGGLVLGSTPVVTKELRGVSMKVMDVSRIVIGFVVAAGIGIASALVYYFTGFSIEGSLQSNVIWIYPLLLVAGFIGASAAVVPGISGSMMMYLMGLYIPVVKLYTTWSNWTKSELYGVMFGGGVCLIIGGIAGFVLTNLWMKDLLAKKHDASYEVILGFIFGSLVSLFVNPQMVQPTMVNGAATRYWIYSGLASAGISGTPIWEWIVGSVLFVGSAILLFYITTRVQKKEAAAKRQVTEAPKADSSNSPTNTEQK